MSDGCGKIPYAALRFIPRRCGVRESTPRSSGVARLASGTFYEADLDGLFYLFTMEKI